MGHPLTSPDQHYTYGDYEKWPEEERWELIDGVAYDMTPAPATMHQRLLGRLFVQIDAFLEGKKCEAFLAPFDVRFPEGNEPDHLVPTVVQPDIAVVCDPAKIDEKGGRGAPDFIIEILSPGTARKDKLIKRDLYARHGVTEYWTLHPLDRILTIYQLQPAGKYSVLEVAAESKIAISVLPGLEIDFDAIFAAPDVHGD